MTAEAKQTSAAARLDALRHAYGDLGSVELLQALIAKEFPGSIAVTSSFGAESAVLLDLVAQVAPDTPILFLDTDALFDETIAYREKLVRRLGLTDIRIIRPRLKDVQATEDVWRTDPDRCCYLRKVVPLERATAGFAALIDGRKGFHGGERANLPTITLGANGVFKVSPLVRWTEQEIEQAFTERKLPRHPLVAQGYRSIGCWPCTRPTAPGESPRAGRWAGRGKSECGIHSNTFSEGSGI
ncbi:phosphoadenylyl-sulfate reductase [Telmatospirillum sp. J64-1]|uniref:phosphoadenylyl-sulfate reductase n=1 Tax=Telmatospirillum sp. J64-1 TaxID=2502183 RepID=UPI00115F4D29|nr:phosphoadenylyl-sulfate reductase [Telmatospirillum sp. J64-1]